MRGLVIAGLTGVCWLAGHPAVAESEASDTAGVAKAGDVVFHEVRSVGQEQSLWCWAAAVQMITGSAQCSQVQQKFSPSGLDCCDPKSWTATDRKRCVRGGWPDPDDLPGFTSTRKVCHSLWRAAGYSWFELEQNENCYLTWEGLKEALREAPVAFSWRYEDLEGQSGHMMVATGYVEMMATGDAELPDRGDPEGKNWVLVHDPWPPGSGDVMLITYERYANGDYQHWRDYYKEAPQKGHH